MIDYGHDETDTILNQLEKRIAKEYAIAEKEISEKLYNYLKQFARLDKQKQRDVVSGKITKSEYIQWRQNKIIMGKRWEDMRESLAEEFYHTNEIARSIIYNNSIDIYALNINYGTYEIEHGKNIDTAFSLYDRNAVTNLLKENPRLLPNPSDKTLERIRKNKDILWNKQQIQSVMMQGILQGESIPKIAKRLSKKVGDKNKNSAIRNARTMATSAENGGRYFAYKRAENLGIKCQKQWMATLDGRTRHSHRMVDKETVGLDEEFSNGLMFPADPNGEPSEVYNCRCAMVCIPSGFDTDIFNSERLSSYMENLGLTYDDWVNMK